MRIYAKALILVVCLWIVPTHAFAQADLCSSLPSISSPGTPPEIIVEQMKQRGALLSMQEQQREGWTSKIISVKNNIPSTTLQALCIFRAEVVPQPPLHAVSVRAPQDQIAAIEDAIKRLDVPQQGPKSVELTVQVMVASDRDETMLKMVPSSLKPVVDQLKGLLSYKQYYLLDTLIGTGADSRSVSLSGDVVGLRATPAEISSYQFYATVRIGNGDPSASTVRLSNLRYNLGSGIVINTEIDIPFGKQVVVGKTTSGDRAFILVVSATVMN